MQDAQLFSLVLGGPLFQLFRRAHLSDDALLLVSQRVVFISLLAWLPLLLLSAVQGQLWSGAVAVPFLFDLEVHIRFLVVVPLLVIAEPLVHQRLHPIGQEFLRRRLIPVPALARFDDALRSAYRWRNSALAEALLVVLVYALGVLLIWRHYIALDASTWYASASDGGSKLSVAGAWYGYVSLPIFQFLLIRWYFRLFIWARFLWQVSRIDLALIPTHPDRLGGLGFLSGTAHAFALLLVAHGAMLAANLANRIFFLGAALTDFKAEILLMAVLLLALVLGPLLVFAPRLARTRRTGIREFEAFAERYAREFDTKWLSADAPRDEPLLGSADIQSLADLANAYEVVRSMRVAPVTREALMQLAAASLVPLLPLALTMMPLEELLKQLLRILF
ncbi:MAG TPA: hypothetical protein VN680_20165 [Burkholderiaceae bacterium]|nr:hypothetical protein [Burkholderiaceae bacterium]